MATIDQLTPGQTVYSEVRQKAGTLAKKDFFPVKIIEIDHEGEWVLASWNNNPAQRYTSRQVDKWRIIRPNLD